MRRVTNSNQSRFRRAIALACVLIVLPLAAAACISDPECENKDCEQVPVGYDAGTGGTSAGGAGTVGGEGGSSGGPQSLGGAGGSLPCGGRCEGSKRVCDESANECVECTTTNHCNEPLLCNTDENTCVRCVDHGHCDDPSAAKCQAGECLACDDSTQCNGIDGKGVCHAGKCVECTEEKAQACNGNPCNPRSNECSKFASESRRVCEKCDTDANCKTGRFCVRMQLDGKQRGSGYCLERKVGICDNPYSTTISGPTLSGRSATAYCGINESLTTCEAVNAIGTLCGSGCPETGICGEAGGIEGRCTIPCASHAECTVSGNFSHCSSLSGDGICGG